MGRNMAREIAEADRAGNDALRDQLVMEELELKRLRARGEATGEGYIVLWDGQPCGLGAVDGTLGIDPKQPTLFGSEAEAQKAIDEKVESYQAYARAYPNMRWPSPKRTNFRIVPPAR